MLVDIDSVAGLYSVIGTYNFESISDAVLFAHEGAKNYPLILRWDPNDEYDMTITIYDSWNE